LKDLTAPGTKGRPSGSAGPGVNFIIIVQEAFVLTLFCQKIAKPNFNYRKAAQNSIAQKVAHDMLVKLTPDCGAP
jgi:hypothetical protein